MVDSKAIIDVVAEAGARAATLWQEGQTVASWEKSPGQPVCEADLAVNSWLREELGRLDPDAGWLSEETADDRSRLSAKRVWVVDPIDGTRDFIRGRRGWAVSVALVEDDRVIFGMLEAPARKERWVAQAGEGATRNGFPLVASRRHIFEGARVPADSLPKSDRDLATVAKPNSIALRMAMVAADEADLVATLRWGHEWDIAAAALIAMEAGAMVTDALGQPLRFNTEAASPFGVLCAAPDIHPHAVDRIRGRAQEILTRR